MKNTGLVKSLNSQKSDIINQKIEKVNLLTKKWYKNIGMGFHVPKEFDRNIYSDKKCPFIGNISIRGRILKGIVISNKMKNSIIVRKDYLHYIPKYKRLLSTLPQMTKLSGLVNDSKNGNNGILLDSTK